MCRHFAREHQPGPEHLQRVHSAGGRREERARGVPLSDPKAQMLVSSLRGGEYWQVPSWRMDGATGGE